MKVLLVGNGAREHVIAEALARSRHNPELHAVMTARNPGILKIAESVKIGDIKDPNFVSEYASEIGADFAVVGPEAPLEKGVADALESEGIPCVGPKKEAARMETDKSFTRELMDKYQTSGRVKHKVFHQPKEMEDFIDRFEGPVVIKPLGLTGGKGVKVVDPELEGQLKNKEEAKEYGRKVIEDRIGGFGRVIVEEKVEGEEFTLQTLVDGKNVVPTPLVQDHKFALEGDTGPFTGGMGSYSDSNHLLPFLEKEDFEKALNTIKEVVSALRKEGIDYRGVLYGGFMLTKDGPKILEFNVRFGDPEAMNVLPILKTDFVDVCQAVIGQSLDQLDIEFEPLATVCKYVVPEGYPTEPSGGEKIEVEIPEGVNSYFASVDQKEDGIYITTSRSMAFVGLGKNLSEAEASAQSAVGSVSGPVFYRKDIGTEKLIEQRVRHMEEIRNR